jgi:YbbR domain-containing protein
MTKRQKFFSACGRFLKDLFTKNLVLKITALLFAILLWGYVLGIENPKYVKRVRDVEIAYTGEDSLNSRGLMLVSREKILTDVDVECELSKHSDLDENVTCTVDLSDRDITLDRDEDSTTITRPVIAKVASGYGTVQGTSVGSVNLTIARVSSRNSILVDVATVNSLPEGYVYDVPDRLTVSLRGQKSKLDRIAKGIVTVDLASFNPSNPTQLAGEYDLILPVQFRDEASNVLDDIVTSSGETVTTNVHIVIRAYKDVPIVPDVVASSDFGAYYEYTCTPTQEKIRIYGTLSAIEQIDSIGTETIVPKEEVGGERLTVSLIIPDGVTIDSKQSSMVTVLLYVSERESDEMYYQIPIEYSAARNDLVLSGTEVKMIRIRVLSTVKAMKSFDPKTVRLSVDLTNYGEGTHELPVVLTFSGDAGVYTIELVSETVTVELISTTETEQPNE